MSVAKHFFRDHTSLDITLSTQERNYINVRYVAESLVIMQRLQPIREFILWSSLTNVMSVTKPFFRDLTSLDIRSSTQERNYINVRYVAESLVIIQSSQPIREFILWSSLPNVMSVAKPLIAHTSGDIRSFIQEKVYINVMYVANSLAKTHTLLLIGEFILERNCISVMTVARFLVSMEPLKVFREFILERNLMNVMNVVRPLVKNHIFKFIGEYILERNLSNVMSVASSSV